MRRFITIMAFVVAATTTLYAQHPVKNIIYMIGDGMGITSVSMMQLENRYEPTIFDRAENVALQKSYSLNNRVTDSAASGTALATGSKTNNAMLGVTPDGEVLKSVMECAQEQGMATGVVVTTFLQHATPAAFYAHIDRRDKYVDISRQLAESRIDVAIGGGMGFFRELYGDEQGAVASLAEHDFNVVTTMDALSMEAGDERVMALVAEYEVPSDAVGYLANATTEALRLLEARDNDNGFVLMVEGSLIDGKGHANDAEAQQVEMQGFMQAIEVAVAYAENHPDTLVVVTADHGTGGLTLISADADFMLSEQGVEYHWSTKGHSGEMVPIYLYGAGAELINGIMENSDLGERLKDIVQR